MFCLNPDYSTTRLVTREKPIVKHTQDDSLNFFLFLEHGERWKDEGGLRTKEYFKRNLPNRPLITIITVVFNGKQYLEETILSVIGQNYDNVEYIIVDGGSTDGTLDIIRKYEHSIDYWISEKDDGIYYAMNKGISLTSGKWTNMMNAGDKFYNDSVLFNVFQKAQFTHADVIFGDTLVDYGEFLKTTPAPNIDDFWKRMPFCHQSSFVQSKIYKKYKFDTGYKITADYHFFYNLSKKSSKFEALNIIVSVFMFGGYSDEHVVLTNMEKWKIVGFHEFKYNVYYLFVMVKSLIFSISRLILPNEIIYKIRKSLFFRKNQLKTQSADIIWK